MSSSARPQDPGFDREVDVLVVGSGAAGMVAALTASAAGMDVLLLEKAGQFGGSSARSGGGCWLPNAPMLVRAGKRDDPEEVLRYLEAIAGDRVSHERLARYVEAAPEMMASLEELSEYLRDGFFWSKGYPDYHPEKGGDPLGRGVWAKPIDRRLLGEDAALLRKKPRRMELPLGAWMTSADLRKLNSFRWGGLRGKGMILRLAWRVARARLTGERIATSGQALITRLRLALRERDVPLWLNTPMRSLITEAGRVVGVEANREGASLRIRARRGVILTTGGFDHNAEMRRRYQPYVDGDWSIGSSDNEGDGILAGERVGAALDLMDDAWWTPCVKFGDGSVFSLVAERQYPGQFIVNGEGRRFVNEACPYTDFVHAQLEGHRSGVDHIPVWMIIDEASWKRNILIGHIPGRPMPASWLDAGVVHTSPTLDGLAQAIGVPADALRETAGRFNRFARQGQDEDFHRGENVYDNYYGDPSYENPNLAPVVKPPFYAFALLPGDLGTKGGLVTDEDARVLEGDGSVVPGLYAAGNTSAAVMGTDYAGPGATLGSAMVFGFVAARDAVARESDSATAPSPETTPTAS